MDFHEFRGLGLVRGLQNGCLLLGRQTLKHSLQNTENILKKYENIWKNQNVLKIFGKNIEKSKIYEKSKISWFFKNFPDIFKNIFGIYSTNALELCLGQ